MTFTQTEQKCAIFLVCTCECRSRVSTFLIFLLYACGSWERGPNTNDGQLNLMNDYFPLIITMMRLNGAYTHEGGVTRVRIYLDPQGQSLAVFQLMSIKK